MFEFNPIGANLKQLRSKERKNDHKVTQNQNGMKIFHKRHAKQPLRYGEKKKKRRNTTTKRHKTVTKNAQGDYNEARNQHRNTERKKKHKFTT